MRNKDAVYLKEHGRSEVLGTANVDLRALREKRPGEVHVLELTLSRDGRSEGQLHMSVHWEKGGEWQPGAAATEDPSSRVQQHVQSGRLGSGAARRAGP